MEITKVKKDAFAVIGKEGSTREGDGWIARLWEEANTHFHEVSGLAKLEQDGTMAGVWGAMSDFSRSFQPWENGFTEGLYLAGIEVELDTEAPEGWKKWVMPASEYMVVKVESETTFPDMIAYMEKHQIELVGAVYDYNCPRENGQAYMYFPIQRL